MNKTTKEWIKIVALIPLIFSISSDTASAENQGVCFMVTSSGKSISLGNLCGVTPADTRVFRVPIKRRSGRTPVIDVTFNGRQSFEMIVDTGASKTLITQGMASTLNLTPSGIINAIIADGSQIELQTGKVRSIGAGKVVVKDVEVAIAPKAEIGLLGHDFFGNYDVKILQNIVEFHRRV
ncbi:retropepsin-like aspartic protease family protein [Mastigocoleus testarum]|uniref:Aspartyl protease n=1 Tax=Mastigocoleus testarum BC008 TaxID=371196 RepID=A0A0V8A0P6_9CYAN|nr:retropepsin-like aspartic protease [Mastigocoleus testarum]KST70356.1 aspartyl protease [Mastigocoleus testarum BC008]